MLRYDILVLLFWTVTALNFLNAEVVRGKNVDIKGRIKRQMMTNDTNDDRWIWGNADVLLNKKNDGTPAKLVSTMSPIEENPCKRPDLIQPDFRVPGRRICEIKCDEYIWQMKYREAKAKKDKDCKEYRKNHPDSDGEISFGIAAIGGRDALPGEFPHMAGIGWKAVIGTWIFKCGGSLISEKFVLTAAHCTSTSTADTTVDGVEPKIVRLGDKNIIDVYTNEISPLDANIFKIIRHPEYKSPKKYNDIALLELQFNLIFDQNIQPACLWPLFDTSAIGTQATVTGWGVVETAGRVTSPVLQAAVVDIVDSETCDTLLKPYSNRNWCGIRDDQICAGKMAGGVDACKGDSGGPLQVKIKLPPSPEGAMHYVIGVTSFGFSCALPNTPGVYARVSTFVDWIESIVWK